jgi:hypothetical protein
MSHGPGIIQRAVLTHLANGNSLPSSECLRWRIYGELRPDRPINNLDELPGSWNATFARSIERLESQGKIQTSRRRLKSLQECVEHYPGKTLQKSVRLIRLELLPILAKLASSGAASPRYHTTANEAYWVRTAQNKDHRAWDTAWKKLLPGLQRAYGVAFDDRILGVIIKGKSLFEKSTFSDTRSFVDLAAGCAPLLPPETAADLQHVVTTFLPADTAGALELKSYVHRFAYVSDSGAGHYSLSSDTLKQLYNARKEFLESLPGFSLANRRYQPEPRHSPLLQKLFDHTVFQKFVFVQLA